MRRCPRAAQAHQSLYERGLMERLIDAWRELKDQDHVLTEAREEYIAKAEEFIAKGEERIAKAKRKLTAKEQQPADSAESGKPAERL
jgi:hypothetical protein